MSMSLTSLFLEDPLMLLMGLVGITVLLWAMARRQDDPRLYRGACVAAGAAVLIIILSYVIETTREHLLDRTGQLVNAVERHDAATLDTLLMPDVRVVGPNGNTWFSRTMLDASLATFSSSMPQWDHRIISLNARQDTDTHATSGVKIRTKLSDAEPVPVPSHWEFAWVLDDQGDWRVQDIRAMEIMNQPANRSLLLP